jgi:hypothetical protein
MRNQAECRPMRESSFKSAGFAAWIDPKGDIPHKLIANRATR